MQDKLAAAINISPTAMSLAVVPVCTYTDQPHSRRTT